MHRSIVLVGLVTLLVSLASIAQARPKVPTVCATWTESKLKLEGDNAPEPVAICTDRAKPVVLRTFKVVEVLDEGGVAIKVVIGWK